MLFSSIEQAALRLRELQPRRKWWRRWARHSAVALCLREGADGLELLMIQRAEREGDRWSGHMGFPGGVLHAQDRNSLAAAMRETQEEIGLDLGQHGRLIARLSDIPTVAHRGQRRPLIISPYVFTLDVLPPLQLNHEVAAVLWVPLRFLAEPGNRSSIAWRRLSLACYVYQDCRIWGLSLQMIDEMLQHLGVAPMAPGALRQSI
jgi:8-oxo-dGTP pyrophosphatase MutT (NUDIX family)